MTSENHDVRFAGLDGLDGLLPVEAPGRKERALPDRPERSQRVGRLRLGDALDAGLHKMDIPAGWNKGELEGGSLGKQWFPMNKLDRMRTWLFPTSS